MNSYYVGSKSYEIVSKVLGIPIDGTWDIIDEDKDSSKDSDLGLVLVNGNTENSKIRGEIIDLKLEKLVCHSYGVIPNCVTDNISTTGNIEVTNGGIEVTDDQTNVHTFDSKNALIEVGFEGTILRMWYDFSNGLTRFSTHKRINSNKSRWVITETFFEMYKSLGGPLELKAPLDRNLTYFFLVVHPSVQMVACSCIEQGRLIFLGSKTESVFKSEGDLFLEREFPKDKPIDISKANELLSVKNIKDYRLDEAYIIIISDKDKCVKVTNPAYAWKCKLRNGDPNLTHLWYSLVTDSYTMGRMALSEESYFDKYPCLKVETIKNIKKQIEWFYVTKFELDENKRSGGDSFGIWNSNQRLHNIFQALLMTVSPSHRKQLINVYLKFFQQRATIVKKLCSLWKLFNEGKTNQIMADFEQKNGSNRVAQILEDVTSYAKRYLDLKPNEKIEEMENLEKIEKMENLEKLVYQNINNLILKENGESLYRLLKILSVE